MTSPRYMNFLNPWGNYSDKELSLLMRDSSDEREQAILRVVINALIIIYFYSYYFLTNVGNISSQPVVAVILTYQISAFIVLLSFKLFPGKSHLRRIYTLLTDIGFLSYGLHLGGATATACFSVYLWLIVGHGMRFGQIYLLAGTILGAIGFTVVLLNTDYWIEQRTAGIGLLIGLVVLPIFFSSLLNKLTKARSVAEEANKTKSQFLANMSHEIRTPLNGVIGMCDILSGTNLSTEQKELVNTLQSSARTLHSLVEDVLDISKIEAGKFTVEEINFDLHELINKTISMMCVQAESKGLRLTSHISPTTPFRLIGDPHHLRQVFINLIGNAIKFTNKGHIDFRVSTIYEDHSNTKIRFEIKDTGIGIPLEAQKYIFDSFIQEDSTTTRRFGGTGLGTTISKQIVEIMGGEIGVHSVVGTGSTFWFQITIQKQKTTDNELKRPLLNGIHALIISNANCNTLKEALDSWGVTHTKYNQDDLTNISFENNYKTLAVILDDTDTEIDISNFPKDILDQSLNTSLPIILITDNSLNYRFEDYYEVGYSSVILNPISKSQLYNAIHSFGAHDYGENITNIFDHLKPDTRENNKLKILVAEDNKTNQLVISKILEHAGHYPYIVENGYQALDALENKNFDMIIMDMQMPDMGGIEATKIYRFTNIGKKILPVIILTANATTEALSECEEANVDAYLTKPIESRKLLTTINILANDASNDNLNIKHAEDDFQENNNRQIDNAIINAEIFDSIASLSSDKHFIDSLVLGFINDTRTLLSKMENNISEEEYDKFLGNVHALKGSAGSIGAQNIHAICKDILSKDTDRSTYITYLQRLLASFSDTKSKLRDYTSGDVIRKS